MNDPDSARFSVPSRLLHWSMAVLVITMVLVGVGMAATVSERYRFLIAIHRPLGIAILLLAIIRLANRFIHPPPPLPEALPRWQRLAAQGSHVVLYVSMIALPLVGWGMLSAAPYPILLAGSVFLPPVLPPGVALYAGLRQTHTLLALLFFLVIVIHLGAALFHGLIRKDGVFEAMASLRRR